MIALISEMTPENQDSLVNLALSMYLGEQCKFCGKEYTTLADLSDAVYAGYHEHGRLACKRCWDEDVAYRKSLDDEQMKKADESDS